MVTVTIVASNEDADRLLKYILSYRKRLGVISLESSDEFPTEDKLQIGIIPSEEVEIVSAEIDS